MKSLLINQNFLFFVILLLASSFMFNCVQGPVAGPHSPRTDEDPDDNINRKGALKCTLPNCSGSKCCDKEDKDCDKWCSDYDYLHLSGDGLDKCLSLEKKFVEKQLVALFNDILTNPSEDKLIKMVQQEELDAVCASVKELDVDLLEDLIEEYSSYDARLFLHYMGVQTPAIEIFEKTPEKEDGVEIFKALLEKAGNSSSDKAVEKILQALKTKIKFEDDDEETVLERALNHNNSRLVQFVHKNIVTDNEEGICGEDNESYHPVPGTTYPLPGGSDAERPAEAKKRQACILAVYCYIDDTREGNRFRRSLSFLLKEKQVQTFIRLPHGKGGLEVPSTQAQKEWNHTACEDLKKDWDNGDIDLGLRRGH